ncbi:MAG: hypothetical protein Ct9H300mP31_19610 [Acidimicrobiaceae bacterium]|nr:MAG: hypothetical protein Ct9H300mP31_19610 [Acidimicrobiaceae bacterium]
MWKRPHPLPPLLFRHLRRLFPPRLVHQPPPPPPPTNPPPPPRRTNPPGTPPAAPTPPPPPAAPTWTSDSTWDMCLVTPPGGRRYEWLNHETWMSLERQRREIQRSLTPDGGGATTASAASREAGDHVALIDGFADAPVTSSSPSEPKWASDHGQCPSASRCRLHRHRPAPRRGTPESGWAGLPRGSCRVPRRSTRRVGDRDRDRRRGVGFGHRTPSVAYGTGFTNGVAHVDPDVEVLSIVHPVNRGEPDADWGATAAREALDGGADVVFGPGSGSGRGVLVEVAGTGYNARNGALCIGAEADDWLQVIKARRCLLTSVLKLPNEFHSMYWRPGRPSHIKHTRRRWTCRPNTRASAPTPPWHSSTRSSSSEAPLRWSRRTSRPALLQTPGAPTRRESLIGPFGHPTISSRSGRPHRNPLDRRSPAS